MVLRIAVTCKKKVGVVIKLREFSFTSWALDSNTLRSLILAGCAITCDVVRTIGERFGVVYCVVMDGDTGNNGDIVLGVVKLLGLAAWPSVTLTACGVFSNKGRLPLETGEEIMLGTCLGREENTCDTTSLVGVLTTPLFPYNSETGLLWATIEGLL